MFGFNRFPYIITRVRGKVKGFQGTGRTQDSPLVCSRRWENRSRVNRRLMELALDREMSNIFHFMGGWISTHP
jgi:hypothetical protein